MATLKGKPTLGFIIYVIIGILHIFIPVWGVVLEEPFNYAEFYWYWGFFFHASEGNVDTGTVPIEGWLTAGRTAMIMMIICFIIILITFFIARALNVFETEKNLSLFGVLWLIIGVLLIIAPSIYVAEVSDVIFRDYSWGVGIFFSYGLAVVPLLLGILILYMKSKGQKIGT
ncbi:MAG: hypothetical protein ACFE8L_03345 [Candidatus Hodarchaeota archaeon]